VCVAALESPHGLRTIVATGAALPLGVASVSAPVRGPDDRAVAAVSVSGPIGRTTRSPGRRYGTAVVEAARAIEAAAGLRTPS
jgi:DNA-binding IclR family transcriptional regulator